MMNWFYRVQQRCALTRREGAALLTLSAFLLLGLVLQHVVEPAAPLPPDPMEDRLFAEGSAAIARRARPDSAGAAAGPAAGPSRGAEAGGVNLNTATSAQLQRLPGVGPKLAARIIEYRDAHGPFRRVQDLVRVQGIGEKTLARLAPHLLAEAE
jgi:competence protein ComEA